MGGERSSAFVQPGGRPPAPGRLALVQAFINTHYDLEVDHGAELLGTPGAAERWFAERHLLAPGAGVTEAERRRVLATREALRRFAAGASTARAVLDRAAHGAPVELRFEAAEPRFVPAEGSGVMGSVGVLLAIVAEALGDGTWTRLKVCPGEDCGWAFYDHSRNQTGRWCSMSVCGGRAKARSHYRRRRRRDGER
jgi:predicted RNA-binding Zn ribbon-like protein